MSYKERDRSAGDSNGHARCVACGDECQGRYRVKYDDETLMAYADGELDAAQCGTDRRRDRAGPGARASRAGTSARCAPGWPARFPGCWTSPFRSVAELLRAPARAPILLVVATCCNFPRAARARRVRPGAPASGSRWRRACLLGVLLSWRLLVPGDSGSSWRARRLAGARRTRARAREPARERTDAVKSRC